MRKSLIVAAALLLAPAVSQARTLEDLLVEKGVITRAEAKAATSTAAPKVYWNEGTRFEFPDTGFTAGIATFLQERYTFTDADEAWGQQNSSSFEPIKARIIVSGTALDKEFSYFLQADFVGTTIGDSNKKSPTLKDAYVQWNACDWGALRMGQYKTFVSRAYGTPDQYTLLPITDIASSAFNVGRQSGLTGYWWTEDKMIEARWGLFNGLSDGEGENRPGVDTKIMSVLGLRVNPVGKMNAYEESDLGFTQDIAASFGLGWAWGHGNDSGYDTKVHSFSVDGNMKYQGFSLNGEVYVASLDTKQTDSDETPTGFYVQGGYLFTPKAEVAARFAMVDCDEGKAWGMCSGMDGYTETTVGLNYYFWKHYLKASLAFVANTARLAEKPVDGDRDEGTYRYMFQLSSYF